MRPVYLMSGLGLDIPILEAIREGLPVYQALRQLVTFFVENGFSLVNTKSTMGYETIYLRMQNIRESSVTLHFATEGNYLTCTLQMGVRNGTCAYGYSIGEKATLTASLTCFAMEGNLFHVYDRDLPFDLALEMYKNRIMEQLYPWI